MVWFLLKRFVDLIRAFHLLTFRRNHPNTLLLINLQKTKTCPNKILQHSFWQLYTGFFSTTYVIFNDVQLEEKVNPSILKDDFSSRIDPLIFTSIEPLLLDWSNKTSWVFPALKSTSHLPQSTVSRRSDSSSEANSSCCHRSEARSHLE